MPDTQPTPPAPTAPTAPPETTTFYFPVSAAHAKALLSTLAPHDDGVSLPYGDKTLRVSRAALQVAASATVRSQKGEPIVEATVVTPPAPAPTT